MSQQKMTIKFETSPQNRIIKHFWSCGTGTLLSTSPLKEPEWVYGAPLWRTERAKSCIREHPLPKRTHTSAFTTLTNTFELLLKDRVDLGKRWRHRKSSGKKKEKEEFLLPWDFYHKTTMPHSKDHKRMGYSEIRYRAHLYLEQIWTHNAENTKIGAMYGEENRLYRRWPCYHS